MRKLLSLFALVPLALSSVVPATSGAATVGAAPDVVSSLAGHWRCTSATGPATARSYVVQSGDGQALAGTAGSTRSLGGSRAGGSGATEAVGRSVGTSSVLRTVYGRADGSPDTGPAFERFTERSDGTFAAQTPEGSGVSAFGNSSSLRFMMQAASVTRATNVSEEPQGSALAYSNRAVTGRSTESAAPARPVAVTYSLSGNGMRRVVTSGYSVLSNESCMRSTSTAMTANCSRANASAATLHAVLPSAPEETAATSSASRSIAGISAPRADSSVQLRLMLDDRSEVVGADVVSAPSAELGRAALAAAYDSTFATETRGCQGISTEYLYSVRPAVTTDAARRSSNNSREPNL